VAAEALQVLELFADACDRLSIPYVVGGSLASGVHGEPRATHASDVLVDPRSGSIAALVEALRPQFYVDEEGARIALTRAGSFNVIHLRWHLKIDVFVAGSSLDYEQLRKRELAQLAPDLPRRFYVTSAEVILVRKLVWYRMGREVSDRQWRDVLAILKSSGARLEREYMRASAAREGVLDLFDRAASEAGLGP
jgi:hypothetical protein